MTSRTGTARSIRYRESAIALVVMVVFVIAGCGKSTTAVTASSPIATTNATTKTTTTVIPSKAADSVGAEMSMRFLRDLSRGWNDNALTWVSAYSDPQVGWEEFLRIQQDVLVAQSGVIAIADLQIRQFPSDVQGPARDIVAHYQDRLDAFDGWARAIVVGDLAAEEDAAAAYDAISDLLVMRPLLERWLDAPTIWDSLEAEGVTSDDLLAAIMGAVPSG